MTAAYATRRTQYVVITLATALALASLLSIELGERCVSPKEVATCLLAHASPKLQLLVVDFRLPRLLMGILVGMGLSVSGAIMQALSRNDLATPGLMGVSAAGRLGVLFAVVLTPGLISPWLLPVTSFVAAMSIALLVLALSLHRGQIDPTRMLLIGMAMSMSLAAAGDVLNSLLSLQQLDFITAWLSGSLSRATWSYIGVLAGYMAVLIPLSCFYANSLNVLAVGDDAATGLGLLVNRSRLGWTSVSVMLTAVCAAFGCTLTFLALLGPHIAKYLVGRDYRVVIPTAALTGAVLVVVADTLCRFCFATNELPVGVVISVLGGCYFLMLLVKDPQ
jgi:iron complex transport system permease protein